MNFNIDRRDVELESTFSPRLWSLVHDGPVLYEALLEKLAHVGLSGMDLRPEAGNGSVGATGLEFRLFGNKVNVQLRLDSFSVPPPKRAASRTTRSSASWRRCWTKEACRARGAVAR